MRYLLIFSFILIICSVSLHSYTIEETLAKIESLKKELAHNEQIVEEKISNLKKTNPLFADQDPFESSSEYAERLKKGQPVIENLRKQYLGDIKQKLANLRNRMFETEYINVTLGEYDPEIQVYQMTVKHLYWQKETYNIYAKINREDAQILHNNWAKVKKTGIRTIDIGDKIGLAKINLLEPIYEIDITINLEPYSTIYVKDVGSCTFDPEGKLIAIGRDDSMFEDNVYLYDLQSRKIIFSKCFYSLYREIDVSFSKNSNFLIIRSSDYGNRLRYMYVYDIQDNDEFEYSEIKIVNNSIFLLNGKFVCDIDKKRIISPDRKYKIDINETKLNNRVIVNRNFVQLESEVLTQKIISRPPSLYASVNFVEPSGNQYLDALEKGEIELTVTNSGKGPGKGLSIKFDPERIEGLNYNNSYIEEIPAGKSVTMNIPVEAYIDVKEADHILRINFDEINGFPPAPIEIGFSTKAYLKPEMLIVDVGVEDSNKNGMIESGETTKLTVRIGNKGKGIATGAYAKFYSEDNVFITDSFPNVVSLGDLEYNQDIDVPLEFFVNDKAADEIPLYVDLTEATGISGVDHLRIPILKSERTREIKRTVVAGIDKDYGDLDFENDLSVDVEQDIPETKKKISDAFAVVLGIENYRNVSDVNFAFRDASIMKEYFSKTIGIPEENIYFRANDEVTLGELRKIFSDKGWLDKRVVENKTNVYFYFAGHGAPAIKEEKAFLIPFDGDPNYPVQTGYSLDTVFENLSKLNAKSVTVFLDACFTGANRENEMLLSDARPVSIQLKNNYVNNVTVFSATSSNEISSSYPENKHGLFSYFLMKGMQGEADVNYDNKLTIQELFDFTKTNVSRTAGTLDREQTPQLECINPDRVIIKY